MTSAAVVARVKRILGASRVGHTGTLDPMATGVLPICVGEGTKVAGHLLAEDKAYEAELELGVETDTLDAEGRITARRPEVAAGVSEQMLGETLGAFAGPSEQVPPMFSAIKQQGKRLHELARAGKTVDRAPRSIIIHSLVLQGFAPPRARIAVQCSKGTYIRSLIADIGARLGCGAHLTALRRIRSGAFTLDGAIPLADVSIETAARALISPAQALAHVPAIVVPEPLIARVASGAPLAWERVAGDAPVPAPEAVVRLVIATRAELALLALIVVDEQGRLRYQRVFITP